MKLEHRLIQRPMACDTGVELVCLAIDQIDRDGEIETLRARVDLLAEIVGALLDALPLTDRQKFDIVDPAGYDLVEGGA